MVSFYKEKLLPTFNKLFFIDRNNLNITDLPQEVIVNIFSNLNAYDLLCTTFTCKIFKTCSYNADLWNQLRIKAGLKVKLESYQEDFLSAVNQKMPKAMLTWADFWSNNVSIRPDIRKADKMFHYITHNTSPNQDLQFKFDVIFQRWRIGFWNCGYSFSEPSTYFDKATPERKLRAELYYAKEEFRNLTKGLEPILSQDEILQKLTDIKNNRIAYPEDRIQAQLYWCIMKIFLEEDDPSTLMQLLDIIKNENAFMADRGIAKFYVAVMQFLDDQSGFDLFFEVSQDKNVPLGIRSIAFFVLASDIYLKTHEHIEERKNDIFFQNLSIELESDLFNPDPSSMYLAIFAFVDSLEKVSNDQATQFLLEELCLKNNVGNEKIRRMAQLRLVNMRYEGMTNYDSGVLPSFSDVKYNHLRGISPYLTQFDLSVIMYNGHLILNYSNTKKLIKSLLKFSKIKTYKYGAGEIDIPTVISCISIAKKNFIRSNRITSNRTLQILRKEAAFFASAICLDSGIKISNKRITVDEAIQSALEVVEQKESIYRDTVFLFLAKMGLQKKTNEINEEMAIQMLQEIYKHNNHRHYSLIDTCQAKLIMATLRFENKTDVINDDDAADLFYQVITEGVLLEERIGAGYYLAKMSHDGRTQKLLQSKTMQRTLIDFCVEYRDFDHDFTYDRQQRAKMNKQFNDMLELFPKEMYDEIENRVIKAIIDRV